MKRETNLPVLIIPGFMSSSLEIRKSESNKSWEGKRIWLNLKSLGFESFTKSGTVNYSTKVEEGGKRIDRDDYYKELKEDGRNNECEKQLQCVNQWLRHVCLAEDMCSENEGIEVRAIAGLEGVDYLTPGALTNHLSYVFGPVINALKAVGYTAKNLDAAPYDWRLSPMTLQDRDGYFDIVMRKVEKLFNQNNSTPVVLLCHSLGCKTGHYFLNWVKIRRGGDEWLDTYIHTYIPVGGPHLGAPKSIRATVDGDKMGLDAFLSNDEGLALGRSLGSGPWLMPSHLPPSCAPPNAYLRRDGVIVINLAGIIDFSPFFKARDPTKLRMAIFYGKEVLTTAFKPPNHNSNTSSHDFYDRFIFAVPYSPPSKSLDTIKVVIYEPGLGFSRQKSQSGPYYSWYCCPVRSSLRLAVCPIKYVCCCPCLLIYRTINGVFKAGAKGTDVTAGALGGATILASSSKIHLSHIFPHSQLNQSVKTHVLKLSHVNNSKGGFFRSFFRKKTHVTITLRIDWQLDPCVPITNNKPIFSSTIPIAAPSSVSLSPHSYPSQVTDTSKIIPFHPKDPKVTYNAIAGHTLIQNEGLQQIQNHLYTCYESDPIGPRSISAMNPPPVKFVKAIYGINLPTEVGAVYKRANVLQGQEKIQKLHDIDTLAKLKKSYYKIQNGILLETKDTPQVILHCDDDDDGNDDNDNPIVHRSGDGTVPYWSLQHCRTWQGHCDVKVHELEHAEHREILADSRFHKIVIDYVTCDDRKED